ncbi:uncharacterized protein METZ01_LOCUS52771, partial [marine metagenome]
MLIFRLLQDSTGRGGFAPSGNDVGVIGHPS